jgi:hypothetical protein
MQREDPDGSLIAAIIEQNNVNTEERGYSGAAVTGADGNPLIEGTPGRGDDFMVGTKSATKLPVFVTDAVTALWEKATESFGPVRFEWVYDRNNTLWVVQLHCGKSESSGDIIYPGEPKDHWLDFNVSNGLDALRRLINSIEVRQQTRYYGVKLVGNVGITSHFGDLLRRAKIPSRSVRIA